MNLLPRTLLFCSLTIIPIKGLPINHESESVETFKNRMKEEIAKMNGPQEIGALKAHAEWYGKAIKLENKLIHKCEELEKVRSFLAIRKWIETQEALLAPEFGDPKAVFKDIGTMMDYHEAKWHKILEKTDEPTVEAILKLLKENGITKSKFCHIIGGFFFMACGGIHVPRLNSYTTEKMDSILRNEFEIHDVTTIHCITHVLMKL